MKSGKQIYDEFVEAQFVEPRPTADRIAELERSIERYEWRIKDWLDYGADPKTPLIEQNKMAITEAKAELSRLRNEQPPTASNEQPKCRICGAMCAADCLGDSQEPSRCQYPATSPGSQDVREADDAWIDYLRNNSALETYEGVKAAFLAGYNAAVAQPDAQPVPTPSSAGLVEAAEWHEQKADEHSTRNFADQSVVRWHEDCAAYLRARAADRSTT